MERLNHEFAAIGFYLSAHPLDTYGPTLEKVKATTYAELRESGSGHFTLAGIVLSKREINNRSEEHTSELQSLMRISYAVFCLKKKKKKIIQKSQTTRALKQQKVK